MKRSFAIVMVFLMLFAGCGSHSTTAPESTTTAPESNTAAPAKAVPVPLASITLPESAERMTCEKLDALGLGVYRRVELDCENPFANFIYESTELTAPLPIDTYLSRDGKTGYLMGSLQSVDGTEGWGTVSIMDENTICYSNYDTLTFIDTSTMQNTGFTLAFNRPDYPNVAISSVVREQEGNGYAVIYQASSYTACKVDGVYRPWTRFSNYEKSGGEAGIGATDAHLALQRFDAQGSYLQTASTSIEPAFENAPVDYYPARYSGETLEFFVRCYVGGYYRQSFLSGEHTTLPCDSGLFPDADTTILYRYNQSYSTSSFTYDWYEQGKLLYSASFPHPRDAFTLGIGNSNYRLEPVAFDKDARTLRMQGYALDQQTMRTFPSASFHDVNFTGETGSVDAVYTPEMLTGKPFLTSPNGRYRLYATSEMSGGEAYFANWVVQDSTTGIITLLDLFNNPNDTVITNDNRLLVTFYTGIRSYSLATGQEIAVPPEFLPTQEQPTASTKLIGGMAYDSQNDLVLLEVIDWFDIDAEDFNPETTPGNIYLRIYSKDWTLLRKLDTGIKARWSNKAYGPYGEGLRIDTPGTVLLGKAAIPFPYL